jgi:predicted HTH transcriptional regulator
VTDEKERAKLRAELDGMIAHLYGVTEEEFAYILTTFPIVPQPVKDAALAAYRELAPTSEQQEIEALIQAGENAKVEFKSSLRWDVKENRVNKTLEQVVVKTIAGFLNAAGGTLLIGVEDNQNVIGLAPDYKTLGKHQDKDGFENLLMTLLLDVYGKDSSPLLQTTFHTLDRKEICKVTASPSPKPVYAKDEKGDHLYIRTGNSTRELNAREAVEYCRMHWK